MISVIVLINWMWVGFLTFKGVLNGSIFVSPAVKDYEAKQTESMLMDTSRRTTTDSLTL
jgi:hypothetical protein